MRSVLKLLASRRMWWLLPQILWTGVSIAFYSGNLVELISFSLQADTQALQFQKAMIAMVFFGVGEILGCFFIGFIVDKISSRKAALFNVGIVVLMIAVTFA